MARTITLVGFDADDTLWHNERFFRITQDRFATLLADHVPPEHLAERRDRGLTHAEIGNLSLAVADLERYVSDTDDALDRDAIALRLDELRRELN